MTNRDDDVLDAEPQSQSEAMEDEAMTAGVPWDVEVDVYLEKACPHPQFHIHTYLPVDSKGYILFDNNHRPGFNIRFNLHDETKSGYTFPPQPKVREACWSQVGTTCPTTAKWEVFEPRRVENGGATLIVYNQNPSPPLGEFKYALRVTKDDGTTYCDLDPGGIDNNGARTFVVNQ